MLYKYNQYSVYWSSSSTKFSLSVTESTATQVQTEILTRHFLPNLFVCHRDARL